MKGFGSSMVKVAILGYGTVGSGVVEVINTNGAAINKRAGQDIEIKYVLDLKDFYSDPIQSKIVHDINIILDDPEVNVVVEVMGGIEPAYTFVKEALARCKSVCTSNKALVAKHGAELLEIAKKNNLNFMFEASVGGGIPIIRPLNQSLTADEITQITGILNGTTNYMLTEMSRKGVKFDEALRDAQEKGYAERNPEADIEGYDACRKIAILTSLAFGSQVDFEDIYTEGITKITDTDFKYADKMGYAIKLLATSHKVDDVVYAMTAPFMISESHPLYSVNGVLNGIYINGNVLGDVMFFGAGAGKLPTASAVVSDIVDCAKHMGKNVMTVWSSTKLELGDISDFKRKFFVRVSGTVNDKLTEVKNAFGNVDVVMVDGLDNEFGFVTEVMSEKAFADAESKVEGVLNRIRIEG